MPKHLAVVDEAGEDDRLPLRTWIEKAATEASSPHDVWAKVRANLDSATVWQAIDLLGPEYCRKVLGDGRRSATTPAGTPRKKAAADARWKSAMEKWQPLSADGSAGKTLGACSIEDVMTAAQIRRKNERANRVWAERYEALANKMKVHRASRVDLLEPDMFWEAMER